MPRRPQPTDNPSTNPDQDPEEQPSQQPPLANTNFKIRLLPGHTEDLTAVTFQILEEDHTLGNALRYIIMKKYVRRIPPDVEYCGYSIPHPSEPKMNLRIQTYGTAPMALLESIPKRDEGKTAVDALEKGLDDLMALCEVVEDKFQSAVEEKTNKMEMD